MSAPVHGFVIPRCESEMMGLSRNDIVRCLRFFNWSSPILTGNSTRLRSRPIIRAYCAINPMGRSEERSDPANLATVVDTVSVHRRRNGFTTRQGAILVRHQADLRKTVSVKNRLSLDKHDVGSDVTRCRDEHEYRHRRKVVAKARHFSICYG